MAKGLNQPPLRLSTTFKLAGIIGSLFGPALFVGGIMTFMLAGFATHAWTEGAAYGDFWKAVGSYPWFIQDLWPTFGSFWNTVLLSSVSIILGLGGSYLTFRDIKSRKYLRGVGKLVLSVLVVVLMVSMIAPSVVLAASPVSGAAGTSNDTGYGTPCSASFCIFTNTISGVQYYYAMIGLGYAVPSTGCALTTGCSIGTIAYGGPGNAGGVTGTSFSLVTQHVISLGGATVLGPGIFLEDHPLNSSSNWSFSGQGIGTTIIRQKAGANLAFMLGNTVSDATDSDITIQQITFDYSSSNSPSATGQIFDFNPPCCGPMSGNILVSQIEGMNDLVNANPIQFLGLFNIIVTNSVFSNSGLSRFNGYNVTVSNNQINRASGVGIAFNDVFGGTVSGNIINGWGCGSGGPYAGIDVGPSSKITITNNILSAEKTCPNEGSSIVFDNSNGGLLIENNLMFGNFAIGGNGIGSGSSGTNPTNYVYPFDISHNVGNVSVGTTTGINLGLSSKAVNDPSVTIDDNSVNGGSALLDLVGYSSSVYWKATIMGNVATEMDNTGTNCLSNGAIICLEYVEVDNLAYNILQGNPAYYPQHEGIEVDYAQNILNAAYNYVSNTQPCCGDKPYNWGTLPANSLISADAGYNPQGFAITTPAVPASGTAQKNTFPFPVRIYLLTGGSGTAVTITDPSGNAQTITETLTAGQEFTLDPGASITLTYTTAPTWKWYGT